MSRAPRPVPLHHRATQAQMTQGLYLSLDERLGSGQCVSWALPCNRFDFQPTSRYSFAIELIALGADMMQSRRFQNWWFRTLMSGRFFEKFFGWARQKKS